MQILLLKEKVRVAVRFTALFCQFVRLFLMEKRDICA